MSRKAELINALASGATLVADSRTAYAGEAVEYAPRSGDINGNPDAYGWHIIGRPDYDRINVLHVEIKN